MWKFVSVFALVLLFTRSNGLPVDSVQDKDIKGSPEIPELSTDLQPPREDAEVIDFRNFETTKDKHTPSTKLELPRRQISTPFRDDDVLTLTEELQPPKKSMAEPFFKPIVDEDEPSKYLGTPSETINERFLDEDEPSKYLGPPSETVNEQFRDEEEPPKYSGPSSGTVNDQFLDEKVPPEYLGPPSETVNEQFRDEEEPPKYLGPSSGTVNGKFVDKDEPPLCLGPPSETVNKQFRDEDEPPLYLRPPSETVHEQFREEDVAETIPKDSSTGLIDSEDKENKTLGAVFIINLFGVKQPNEDENASEVLTDDVVSRYPEMLEPVATVILVLEEADESKPLDLDEFAKDLEEEGVEVEKITENGETKVIKVDFDKSIGDNDIELIKPGKFNKVRRRRSPCLHCEGGGLLSNLLNKHRNRGGGGGGGGCQTCGGGYPTQGTIGVIPVVVVQQQQPQYHPRPPPPPPPRPHYQPQPIYVQPQPHYVQPQPQPQPHYVQPQPVYRPPSNGCNTCGGGNHGSYSQSSAQASAQSSSNSW